MAYKGAQSISGSAWENQTLFNLEHEALPAIEMFEAGGEH
ncbi:MAG: hypothetical protein K9I94_07425 [Bacteroidales bacterium]|nr:hypothetical protein [Bacteroidales bacterium]